MSRFAFDDYAVIGDSDTHEENGFVFVARIEHDPDTSVDDYDCYNDKDITAWKNNEWFFACIVINVIRNGVTIGDYVSCIGGVEINLSGNNTQAAECADDILDEVIDQAPELLNDMLKKLSADDADSYFPMNGTKIDALKTA